MRKRNKWETPFLFSQKKKEDSKNGKNSKNLVFLEKMEYSIWENKKGKKKDNQI